VAQLGSARKVSTQEVCEGYRRLAFGSIADALRLLTAESPPMPEELERMDFFNVSDIKCPKNGGLEIKFFDRLKALDKLAELGTAGEDTGLQAFYQALDKGAAQLGETPTQ